MDSVTLAAVARSNREGVSEAESGKRLLVPLFARAPKKIDWYPMWGRIRDKFSRPQKYGQFRMRVLLCSENSSTIFAKTQLSFAESCVASEEYL